jgi:hypothetical protein
MQSGKVLESTLQLVYLLHGNYLLHDMLALGQRLTLTVSKVSSPR